jgi:hypothetical protein
MGNSSSVDNQSDKSSESDNNPPFDLFDESIIESGINSFEQNEPNSFEQNEPNSFEQNEPNSFEQNEPNSFEHNEHNETVKDIMNKIVKNVSYKHSLDRKVKVSFDGNLNENELKVKKSSHYLLKRLSNSTNHFNYTPGTLEYAFLNSLLYINIDFELNNDYVKDSNLENIVILQKNKIKFIRVNNTIESIIKNLLRNKPVLFQYNIIDGVDSSNWIIDDFEKKRNIINSRTGIIIGYDSEFKLFKIFDENMKYFPFSIIINNDITYKVFSYVIE